MQKLPIALSPKLAGTAHPTQEKDARVRKKATNFRRRFWRPDKDSVDRILLRLSRNREPLPLRGISTGVIVRGCL